MESIFWRREARSFQGVNKRKEPSMQLGSGKPQCPLMSNKLRLGPRKRRRILGRGWAPGIPTSMLAVLKPSLAANLDSLASLAAE